MKKILIICLVLTSIGCIDKEKAQILYLIGKQIHIDESYQSLSVKNGVIDSLSVFYEFKKPIKIVTYMDRSSCTQCAMQILIEWNKILQDVKSDSVGFVTIVYPTDKAELESALNMLKLSNTLLYDTYNNYLKDNKLSDILARNRTFLLDKNNKVVLVGEPLHKPKLWDLYKSSIQILINNKGVMP